MSAKAFAAAMTLSALTACAAPAEPEGSTGESSLSSPELAPSDAKATAGTRALFATLAKSGAGNARGRALLGQQEADVANTTAYGLAPVASDVARITGRLPALVGYELSSVDAGSTTLFDPAAFRRGAATLRARVLEKHARGISVSLVWHLRCPKSSPSEPDRYAPASCPADYSLEELSEHTTSGARGKHFDEWRTMLDELGALLGSLVEERGALVPVQIRPFHEMTGDWFWWGRTNDPAVYRRVWRETVTYLREHHGVHNALWVFCPDKPTDAWQTSHGGDLERFYPGDDVVDVVGFDRYDDDGGGFAAGYAADLERVGAFARGHRKIAAVTEIGRDAKRLGLRPGSAWFTRSMLAPLMAGPGRSFSYVALWRNAPWETYVPAPGDADGEADFAAMAGDLVLAGQ